jgi:multiple sugar transport system substrate-binding protein
MDLEPQMRHLRMNVSSLFIVCWWFLLPLLTGGCGFARPEAGRVTIRYLTLETGVEQQALIQEMVRRFEAEHPAIHVQVEVNATAQRKVLVELASGTAPDVFYTLTDTLPKMAAREKITDLRPLAARDRLDLRAYFPQTVDGLSFRGGLYALPIHFSTDVLFFNRKLFDEAGVPYPNAQWTWADYLDAARRLTRDRDGDGRPEQRGTVLPDPSVWILQNGGTLFNADGTRCTIDSPAAAEALQFLLDMRDRWKVTPTSAELQDTSTMQLFETGRVAMLPGRTFMVIEFNKAIKDFTYGVTHLPQGRRRACRLAVGGNAIARQTRHLNEAWEFVKFYSGAAEGMQVFGREKNAVPAVKEIALSPQFFNCAPPADSQVFIDSVRYAQLTTPKILPALEYVSRIRNPLFEQVFVAGRPPAEALAEIERRANQLLAEQGD